MTCDEKLNSLKIPLIVKGSGPPLIMLHGFLSCKEAFASQIEYFSKYFKVVAYDLCGFGKNLPMPYAYSLKDYLAEFNLIANCFDEGVNVLGHSFGCRVLLYAMANGSKINKAVLCGVAGIKPKFKISKCAKRCVYRLIRPLFKKEWLEKHFFSKDYNALCEVQKKSFKLIVSDYLDERLKLIKNPVLAIFGSEDKETPPKAIGEVLNKNLTNCTVIKIANSGHFCFVQQANEFNLIAREFLL